MTINDLIEKYSNPMLMMLHPETVLKDLKELQATQPQVEVKSEEAKVDTYNEDWITKLWEEQIKPGYDGRGLELFKRQIKKYLPHQK